MQRVYCDIRFWEQFIETFPVSVSPMESSISKMKCYLNLFDFMCRSSLVFNIPKQQVLSKVNDDIWLKILWKKANDGSSCSMDFDECDGIFNNQAKFDSNISNDMLKAVYFINESPNCTKEYFEQLGVMYIDVNSVTETNNLFIDSGITISKQDFSNNRFESNNWRCLNKINRNTHNSLIIIDPYILSDNRFIGENLGLILEKLLPDTLAVDFHLTIISQSQTRDKYVDLQNRYEEVKSFIFEKRPKLNVVFTIYDDTSFHDRIILSNYISIECGAGFDLFKNKKPKNDTTIRIIYPYFQNTMDSALTTYLQNIVNSRRTSNIAKKYGDEVLNRLLE